MDNKTLKKRKRYENNTENTKKTHEFKNRISQINKLIVDLEFDNRQLRIGCTYLRS
jgi:hypothetical protein